MKILSKHLDMQNLRVFLFLFIYLFLCMCARKLKDD